MRLRATMFRLMQLATTCVVCLCARPLAAQSATPIFRYISIEPFGRIELGDLIDAKSPLFVPAGRGHVRLQPKSDGEWHFADTRAILLARTKQRTVCAIVFQYLPSKLYTEAVVDYRKSLGDAPEQRQVVQGRNLRSVRWQDSKTTFTFAEVLVDKRVLLESRMEDRHVPKEACAVP